METPAPLSCGEYPLDKPKQNPGQPRCPCGGGFQRSDRIFFRKDWVDLALAVKAVRVVETYYARERSDRAEGVQASLGQEPQLEQLRQPSAGEDARSAWFYIVKPPIQ